MKAIAPTILEYNQLQQTEEREICEKLQIAIDQNLANAESKIWHGHPVWFINQNPIVGYSKQKAGIRLMFWSGAAFGESDLKAGTGKFQDASIFYTDPREIDINVLKRWLKKAEKIQWDYKNIVKRKGKLEKLEV